MWCLTSRESLEVLAADNVGRKSGREEATSIRVGWGKRQLPFGSGGGRGNFHSGRVGEVIMSGDYLQMINIMQQSLTAQFLLSHGPYFCVHGTEARHYDIA